MSRNNRSTSDVAPPDVVSTLDPPNPLQCLLCRAIFKERSGPRDRSDEWNDASKELNEDGIAELVRIAEGVVADERDRGRQLDTKSTSLAGFSGLILTIDTALARSVLNLEFGGLGNIFARGGFAVASVALLAATALAIAGVLMPQKYRGLGRNQVDDFCGPAFQTKPATEIHRGLLQSLSLTLAQDRAVNDCKARLTKGVAGCLLVGFLGLAASALTLGLHNLNV